jgi:hypothetical protein
MDVVHDAIEDRGLYAISCGTRRTYLMGLYAISCGTRRTYLMAAAALNG